jgi:uncharacterized membrane protein YbhN (UPF0104 family)
MRRVKAVLLVLGIVAIVVSVYRIGPAPILVALARLTWWQLVLVCVPYAAIMTLLALYGFLGFYLICIAITWWFYTRRDGLLFDVEHGDANRPAVAAA